MLFAGNDWELKTEKVYMLTVRGMCNTFCLIGCVCVCVVFFDVFLFALLSFLFRYGQLVLKELRAISPAPGDEPIRFRRWLLKLYLESEAPLVDG